MVFEDRILWIVLHLMGLSADFWHL